MNKISYGQLLNEWKKFLINEDSDSLEINSQIYKAIEKTKEFKNQLLKIKIENEGNEYFLIADFVSKNNTEDSLEELAHIMFRKFPHSQIKDREGKIRNAYIIEYTKFVKYNLGPLMYDLIIEFASNDNSFLCSDRFEISNEAQNLWQNYLNRRSDVETVQLDIENENLDIEEFPNLTPDWRDDFYQNTSIKDKGKKWFESPFSKGYYKNNMSVVDNLRKNKLFVIDIPGT